MDIIVDRVAFSYDLSVEEICVAKRGNSADNAARWIAMKLCQEVGGAKLTEIGKLFNVEHYSAVLQTIRRLNVLVGGDAGVEKHFNMLSQDLTPYDLSL